MMGNKIALVSGIGGQTGSYMAELLLSKGYEVHGILRRSSHPHTGRIDHIKDRLHLHYADMADALSLDIVVQDVRPSEVYNFAAQSQVRTSFDMPEYTLQVTGAGALRLLESCWRHVPRTRFYQASTSEMFGDAPAPQNEDTPFRPRSPYAAAKCYAHYMARNFREAYGMFVCCGILMNHESERRSEEFVTRKITRAVGRIRCGLQKELRLGNLDALRDWGHAEDFCRAIWLMLQQKQPDDYVVGTGEAYAVSQFLSLAFEHAGLSWLDYVVTDEALKRPAEVPVLRADATKARRVLGWEHTVSFAQLVWRMVQHDLRLAEIEAKQVSMPAHLLASSR